MNHAVSLQKINTQMCEEMKKITTHFACNFRETKIN